MNGLEKDSVALIFPLQALDKRRLITKIGYIEKYYLEEIDKSLSNLLKI